MCLHAQLHTVCCGVVSSWYFIEPDAMPARPTVASFKRATTYSLGSIAFGSLIVSLIQVCAGAHVSTHVRFLMVRPAADVACVLLAVADDQS